MKIENGVWKETGLSKRVYSWCPNTGLGFLCESYPAYEGMTLSHFFTLEVPPEIKNGQVWERRPKEGETAPIIEENSEWVVSENHIDTLIFNKKDPNLTEFIKKLGPIPNGYTTIVPPKIKAGESVFFVEAENAWTIVAPSKQFIAAQRFEEGQELVSIMATMNRTPSDELAQIMETLYNVSIEAAANATDINTSEDIPLPELPADIRNPSASCWIKNVVGSKTNG